MIGEINKKTPLSAYQPSQDIVDLTSRVKKDYDEGIRILHTPWEELNNRSVIEDYNRGLKMFNAFVDENVENPNDAWRWIGTRSMARNKGIAMHAQLTANYLLPLFTAQNDKEEIDRDFSEVMRDIAEWLVSPTNSNYQSSFLQLVFSTLYSPATYLSADFFTVYQNIKRLSEDGKIKKEKVLDDVLSGFRANIYSVTQVLITNPYERNMQKQRAVIKRRYIEYEEAKAKYGEHKNFDFVQPGVKSIYSDEDGLFYDVKDDDHKTLVAEEIWLSRREDMEVPFINGIYFGDDNVEGNPIKHRDNKDKPKINLVPFGYHRIGEHFFFYKSQMNALGYDNDLYDEVSRQWVNRGKLELDMPVAISGIDKIDGEVVFPKAVVALEDKDARITPLLPPANMAAGAAILQATEKSMSDASVNETIAGQLPEASQKAYNVAQAQASARKLIGAVGKSLAESVAKFGDLMKDIIINHITVPEVDQLTGDTMKLKYRTFMLEDKERGGKKMNKKIVFDEGLIGKEMTEDEAEEESLKMYEESGEDEELIRINPELFAKFNYLVKVDVEEMFAQNKEYWQGVLTSLYGMLRQDPLVNSQTLLRKLAYAYFQSEADDIVRDEPVETTQQPGLPSNGQLAAQVGARQASNAADEMIV